eukprot:266186_1
MAFMSGWLFSVLSWCSTYIFMSFCVICVATGIYFFSELAEEYTVMTRRIITAMIVCIITVHVLLWAMDEFNFMDIAVGIAAHVFYYRLIRKFPEFQFISIDFLLSVALLGASHWMWWKFFASKWITKMQIMGFFWICVWLVPLALVISLSANDYSIPMSSQTNKSYDNNEKSRRAFGIKSVLKFLRLGKQREPSPLPQRVNSHHMAQTSHSYL